MFATKCLHLFCQGTWLSQHGHTLLGKSGFDIQTVLPKCDTSPSLSWIFRSGQRWVVVSASRSNLKTQWFSFIDGSDSEALNATREFQRRPKSEVDVVVIEEK